MPFLHAAECPVAEPMKLHSRPTCSRDCEADMRMGVLIVVEQIFMRLYSLFRALVCSFFAFMYALSLLLHLISLIGYLRARHAFQGNSQITQNIQPEAVSAVRAAREVSLSMLPLRIVEVGQSRLIADGCCPVCLEHFLCGDEQRILPCSHAYHRACIDEWLHSHGTCPICRLDICEGLVFSCSEAERI